MNAIECARCCENSVAPNRVCDSCAEASAGYSAAMTTPNDAARPGQRLSLDADGLGVYEDDNGDYVLAADYDALREEMERLQRAVDHAHRWYATRLAKIEEIAKREGLWDEVATVIANGSSNICDPPPYAQQLNSAKHRAEAAEAKLQSIGEWITETQTKATALQCARNQTDRDTGHVIETMLGYVRAALNEGDGE